MLVFGVVADKIGRKSGMLCATAGLFVFSALSAGSKGVGGVSGTLKALIAWRALLGVAIGAEYPSGSVAASENSEDEGVSKNKSVLAHAPPLLLAD